jgi:stage III sporulation protein AH
MKNTLKKNQIVIYVIALMLVAAGYLNYTANEDAILQTSSNVEEYLPGETLASIGDATLVSSDDVVSTEIETQDEEIAEESSENSEDTVSTVASQSDYFATSKLDRDAMFSQMLESYQNIVDSSLSSDEQRSIATQEIVKINNAKNGIMVCENLIQTKGFSNVVVFVNGDSVNVVVQCPDELEADGVAQIQNIVSRELSVEVENIHISNK